VAVEVITTVLEMTPEMVLPTERIVLYVLAWHTNRHSLSSWPSVPTIARESSLDRRSVQRILKRLCEKNLLVAQGKRRRGSVEYALNLDAIRSLRYRSDDCGTLSQSEPPHCGTVSQSAAFSTDVNSDRLPQRSDTVPPEGAAECREGGGTVPPELSLNRYSEP